MVEMITAVPEGIKENDRNKWLDLIGCQCGSQRSSTGSRDPCVIQLERGFISECGDANGRAL